MLIFFSESIDYAWNRIYAYKGSQFQVHKIEAIFSSLFLFTLTHFVLGDTSYSIIWIKIKFLRTYIVPTWLFNPRRKKILTSRNWPWFGIVPFNHQFLLVFVLRTIASKKHYFWLENLQNLITESMINSKISSQKIKKTWMWNR